jgi:hypothetical protein
MHLPRPPRAQLAREGLAWGGVGLIGSDTVGMDGFIAGC